ncbi:transposase [Candidatus Pacearchaeota archaeon]|nr:transposase [Candidatus Pacearchaeota archaeon]
MKAGKPVKLINPKEESMVKETYEKYRICASRLAKKIERDYNVHIPVYTIHKIMLGAGLAKHKEKKDLRKKKWVRYERKHSLTAVHMDWLYHPELRLWALPVIDDSTRKLLSLIETESATTNASIDAIEQAVMHGQIKQCITDHGPQFTANERGESRFQQALIKLKIKHILTKIKHPQSNGKSEKFGHLYLIHRTAFNTKEEFIKWYNNVKPHMSLDERTPEEVYQERKHEKRVYYT